MKKILLLVAAFAVLSVTPTSSRAQGAITVSTVTSNQFNSYMSLAYTTAFLDTRGGGGFLPQNSSQWDGPSMMQTSFMLTNGNGSMGLSYVIQNGQFNSTGAHGSWSITQTQAITGVVIGLFNPLVSQGTTASVLMLYINGTYYPVSVDASSSAFAGLYYQFATPVNSLNAAGQYLGSLGSTSGLYMIPMTGSVPTPEPGTCALAALGSTSLLLLRKMLKEKQ